MERLRGGVSENMSTAQGEKKSAGVDMEHKIRWGRNEGLQDTEKKGMNREHISSRD